MCIRDRHGGEHGAGMMRLLLDAGADANELNHRGSTALMLTAEHGGEHAEAMVRLLVARGATLPRAADALHPNTPSALVSYLDGARSWTTLHRAADARDHDALVALMSDRLPSGVRPDEAVDSPHPHMRTALAIAGSDSYPTARPVCERCLALLRLGGCGMVKGAAPAGGGGVAVGGGVRVRARGGGGGGGASRQSRHK